MSEPLKSSLLHSEPTVLFIPGKLTTNTWPMLMAVDLAEVTHILLYTRSGEPYTVTNFPAHFLYCIKYTV